MIKKYVYQQFTIGVCKVIKTCGSLAITIKKDFAEKFNVKQGDELIVIILRRNTFADEITESEIKEILKNQKQDLDFDVAAAQLKKNLGQG